MDAGKKTMHLSLVYMVTSISGAYTKETFYRIYVFNK
jgi:hypothetical protein